jgi:acyl-CoA hydrolase
METATRHFVRPEFMNHHQSLYAGYLSEWVAEAAFIGIAKVLGHTDHVVLAAMKDINIRKPVYSGSILEMRYELKNTGTTSVEILVEGVDFLSGEKHVAGTVIFVTVDDEGKKKAHGLKSA